MKKIILITDVISNPDIEELVLNTEFDIFYLPELEESNRKNYLREASALLVWHAEISRELIAQMPNCKLIVRYGTGYDNIDLEAVQARGIKVCNNPDYGVDEVADTTCALILNAIRQISLYDSLTKSEGAVWSKPSKLTLMRSSSHKLGIIGAGRIGTSVARKMKGFGIEVGIYDPYVSRGYEKAIGVKRFESISELQGSSSIISFHCPLTEETKGVLNKDFILNLKDNTIIINTSRGGLIRNVEDLDWGLRNSKISFLGLDVAPTEPINSLEEPIKSWLKDESLKGRITITPHTAYYSEQSYEELRMKAAMNIKRFFDGHIPFNIIV
jgi:D-3-phosphoglycerate dehydrogenase